MTSIPKAADLPVGTVVADDVVTGIRLDKGPRYAEWDMSNGGRYYDDHIDRMLAEGAQVLRWGTQPVTPVRWIVCTVCGLGSDDIQPPSENWHLGQPATVQRAEDGGLYVDPHRPGCPALAAEIERRTRAGKKVLVVDEGYQLARAARQVDLDALYRAGMKPGLSIDPDEAIRPALQLIGVEDTEENRAKVAAIPARVAAILNPPPAVLDALSTDPDDSATLAYVEIPVDEATARAVHDHTENREPLPPDLAERLRRLGDPLALPMWVTGELQPIPADWFGEDLPRGYVWWSCRYCGQGRVFRGSVTEEGREALAHQESCPCRAAVENVDGRDWLRWTCGCLDNEAGAHRIGCPRYPDGKKG